MIESKPKVKNANSGQLFRPDWVSSAECMPHRIEQLERRQLSIKLCIKNYVETEQIILALHRLNSVLLTPIRNLREYPPAALPRTNIRVRNCKITVFLVKDLISCY